METVKLGISVLDVPAHKGRRICLDASVAINVLATGYAEQILASSHLTFCIEESAHSEIKRHPVDGGPADPHLLALCSKGLLAVESLGEAGQSEFIALVRGGLSDGLGDGEAATLALSQDIGGIAAIDDQKALRIAKRQYTASPVTIISTLDILAREEVVRQLSGSLQEAVANALQRARMRVPRNYEKWVRDCIGAEGFRNCNSIRLAARMAEWSD